MDTGVDDNEGKEEDAALVTGLIVFYGLRSAEKGRLLFHAIFKRTNFTPDLFHQIVTLFYIDLPLFQVKTWLNLGHDVERKYTGEKRRNETAVGMETHKHKKIR